MARSTNEVATVIYAVTGVANIMSGIRYEKVFIDM